MQTGWLQTRDLPPEQFRPVRERTIFECGKWDPQVEDVSTLAPFPLFLTDETWRTISALAERLAQETLAAEQELVGKPPLVRQLGLPRAIRRLLERAARRGVPRGVARIIRFDFHLTTDGWKISEANTDVPGGFIEASGFTRLMAEQFPEAAPAGDPAAAYADALARATHGNGAAALVHATAYTDDRSQMIYVAQQLEARGLKTCLVGPDQLRWNDEHASIANAWSNGQAGVLIRFFPAEWLPNLPRDCGWKHFFLGGATPMSNPGPALLTQSKRLPLVWDALSTPLATWRELLPETHDPRHVNWRNNEQWVLKPALGRVGDGVGIPGITEPKEWKQIVRSVRRYPRAWVAQRRFQPVPFHHHGTTLFPCVGVFTVDGRTVGAYGRVGSSPLINYKAQDAPVLIVKDERAAAQLAA